jgi:hypothetical protein
MMISLSNFFSFYVSLINMNNKTKALAKSEQMNYSLYDLLILSTNKAIYQRDNLIKGTKFINS